ncbi:alpha/beta hydrolase family protein [Alloscardovia macacae]|uniref:Esterase n=1 Tax=Alloscardovia macacae TaxID=1160091 RepID=A0A261F240_9BIFI|nr:acyl-CoA thioester hydrolase/BAAT C-terminal domain-containing protein [Alloscardovia macacae]OZG53187.1 esterase [Alloscardovia macacae]
MTTSKPQTSKPQTSKSQGKSERKSVHRFQQKILAIRTWYSVHTEDYDDGSWRPLKRVVVVAVVFAVLMGLFMGVSRATSIDWTNGPRDQIISSTGSDTSVTFGMRDAAQSSSDASAQEGRGAQTSQSSQSAQSSQVSEQSAQSAQSAQQSLPRRGTYAVKEIHDTIDIVQDGTGEVQKDNVILRIPENPENVGEKGTSVGSESISGSRELSSQASASSGSASPTSSSSTSSSSTSASQPHSGMPAAIFVHGAGTGNADDSFNDVAADLASAGFATLVMDKPRWKTWDATRDYPSSAKAYLKGVQYLRDLSYVNDEKVGIFTTSEGTWISPYMVREDKRIAFQVMMSPMVFSPRHSLAFSVAQIFAIVGANQGYQNFVQRIFSLDLGMFGITNIDFESQIPQGYNVPILVAYGAKDVLTAQVSGAQRILELAHSVGNWDVTVRTYPIGNHVLRLGDQTQAKTLYVDHYEYDFVDWAVGVTRDEYASGALVQTSSKISGADVQQPIAVPQFLQSHRALTIYFVLLHAFMLLWILVTLILGLYALGRKLYLRRLAKKTGEPVRHVFGFQGRYQRTLLRLVFVTLLALLIFVAGVGQLIWRVVNLIWGAAPPEPGVTYWSWYAIQVVCILVVLTWALMAAAAFESLSVRLARAHAVGETRTLAQRKKMPPLLASERFGIVFFNVAIEMMFSVLLVFAYWGLFIY